MEYKQWSTLILRVFFGVAFLVAGLDKALSFQMAKGMFAGFFGSFGTVMLVLAILIELGAGSLLLIGYKTKYPAIILAGMIFVAFIVTFKLGAAPHMSGSLREVMVMNTGGGNTAVNFAYFAGLLSLAFSGSSFKAIRPD